MTPGSWTWPLFHPGATTIACVILLGALGLWLWVQSSTRIGNIVFMQGGGGGPEKAAQQEEERARQQEMKNAMLAQLLDQQARARCESSCFESRKWVVVLMTFLTVKKTSSSIHHYMARRYKVDSNIFDCRRKKKISQGKILLTTWNKYIHYISLYLLCSSKHNCISKTGEGSNGWKYAHSNGTDWSNTRKGTRS